MAATQSSGCIYDVSAAARYFSDFKPSAVDRKQSKFAVLCAWHNGMGSGQTPQDIV